MAEPNSDPSSGFSIRVPKKLEGGTVIGSLNLGFLGYVAASPMIAERLPLLHSEPPILPVRCIKLPFPSPDLDGSAGFLFGRKEQVLGIRPNVATMPPSQRPRLTGD